MKLEYLMSGNWQESRHRKPSDMLQFAMGNKYYDAARIEEGILIMSKNRRDTHRYRVANPEDLLAFTVDIINWCAKNGVKLEIK